ncbi:MAG: hypothetical protein QW146_08245 [Candidatus Bathyarchaeia archaeon]
MHAFKTRLFRKNTKWRTKTTTETTTRQVFQQSKNIKNPLPPIKLYQHVFCKNCQSHSNPTEKASKTASYAEGAKLFRKRK